MMGRPIRSSTLAMLFTSVALSAAAQPPPGGPPRDRGVPAQTGTAIIRGRVFAGDTGRPLRRARIFLSAPELGSEPRTTSTNLDGRYEIKELPAGRYSVRVNRSGYLPLQYGQQRPLEQGKPLQVLDKQTVDNIDFTLPRSSIITGRITDELSEPVADVQVFALRTTYFQGRRRAVPIGQPARTDDAGEYRLTGLSPGPYYVMAQLRETWTATENGVERMLGYAPTYFPGTPALTDARRVNVAVGQTSSNNNFPLMPGGAANVSGTATDSTGNPLAGRPIAVVQELVGPSIGMVQNAAQGTTAANGAFDIKNVPPGQYKLRAQTTRDTHTSRGTVLEVASQMIAIDGVDISNLSLTTTSGWMMSGRVVTENGSVPDVSPTRFRLGAVQADPDSGAFGGAPPPPPPPGAPGGGAIPDSGRVKDDWTFLVTSIFGAARPRVQVPDGWTVKAVIHDGRDVFDTPLESKSGEELTDVQVIVVNQATTVTGQLVDAKGAPLRDGTVIVFAADQTKWFDQSRWIRAVRPDQQGKYEIKGLPPGEYLAAAVDYVEDGLWNDAEYLDAIRRDAQKVTLGEGASRTLSLKLVTP